MRNRLTYIFVALLGIGLTAFVYADDPADRILSALGKFTTDHPQEKAFLHVDKPYYAAGDTIWYKAYTVDAKLNKPSVQSAVLYVDLVNERDSLVSAQKVRLTAGLGNAQIAVPLTIKPGNYTLFAYTNRMRNYDDSFFFKKVIRIENPFVPDIPSAGMAAKTDLQFFPEGGELVDNIRSVVAFKATGSDGLGVQLTGFVADQNNEKLFDFTTEHDGMGIFPITPLKGMRYTAVVSDASGNELRFPLPAGKPEGYVMAVNNRDTAKLAVKVSLSPQLVSKAPLLLVLQQNGQPVYATKFTPGQVNNIVIPKDKLRMGIVQITLFKDDEPLAERLVFIDHADLLSSSIQLKDTYAPFEKVQANMRVVKGNTPVQGSFSVSVTDASRVVYDAATADDIVSNLLLTSDLKGQIGKPGYYFSGAEDAPKYLDYLMLTQGWRRFVWKQVLAGDYPPATFPAEAGLSISGRILTQSDKPLARAKATLLSSRGQVFTVDTLTDNNGYFNFNEMSFPDSTIFVVQAQKENGNRYIKTIFDADQVVKHQAFKPLSVTPQMEAYIANTKAQYEMQYQRMKDGRMQIAAVEIKGNKKAVIENSRNLNGSGHADQVITAQMLETAYSLTDYISKYVSGVEVFRAANDPENKLYFKRNGDNWQGMPMAPIQFIVDGVEIDQSFADNISVADIEGVEVLKSAAYNSIYGSNGIGGTIIVTMKRGRYRNGDTAPGVSMIRPKGYVAERQFYSPKYPVKPSSANADLRTTIYWNANIITDKNGNAQFDFYTSGVKGQFKVVLQGIDADGNLLHVTQQYTVK